VKGAGSVALAAEIGHEVGVAAATSLNARSDRNLSELQKAARAAVEQGLKTYARRTGKTPDRTLLDAVNRAIPDQRTVLGTKSSTAVNLRAALDFLQKYGDKSAETKQTIKDIEDALARQAASNKRAIGLTTQSAAELNSKLDTSKTRVLDLAGALGRLPKETRPKLTVDSSDAERRAAHLAGQIGALKNKQVTITAHASLVTTGNKVTLGKVQTAGNVVFVQGSAGKQLLAGGGWVLGPGTGTSDSVPLMGSRGEFMLREKVASKYPRQVEALNAGVPLEKVASGGGGLSMTNYITVADNRTALSAPDQIAAKMFAKGFYR
jgi:hypothetical protein